jgi:3-deoxy-D-manno-octulosonic-acid transferase
MNVLYNLSIYLYGFFIHCASFFNTKAALWVKGRKDWEARLNVALQGSDTVIWFHCASLGEFEQGRPLIEKIKIKYPQSKILLTFFSPSGYEIRKNYSGADLVFYLPLDTVYNARTFIDIVKPERVFFVKYEFWFNFLRELKNRNIPTYLISAIFRREQHFFSSIGKWSRQGLDTYKHIFVQDENSLSLLNEFGYNNVIVAGDTRFDRVNKLVAQAKKYDLIQVFKGEIPLVVAGSTWQADEDILASISLANFKLIIAPHEISESNLGSLMQKFSKYNPVRYSEAHDASLKNAWVLIIDNIGMLSSLYGYASIAYIGGGFGKGIHNVLEAAAFGMPVFFGPNYQKFKEALELIQLKAAYRINSTEELKEKLNLFLNDSILLKETSLVSKKYIQNKIGATDKILNLV